VAERDVGVRTRLQRLQHDEWRIHTTRCPGVCLVSLKLGFPILPHIPPGQLATALVDQLATPVAIDPARQALVLAWVQTIENGKLNRLLPFHPGHSTVDGGRGRSEEPPAGTVKGGPVASVCGRDTAAGMRSC